MPQIVKPFKWLRPKRDDFKLLRTDFGGFHLPTGFREIGIVCWAGTVLAGKYILINKNKKEKYE